MSFSSEDRRRSVTQALEKYYEKTKPKEKTGRKNKAPEKDVVKAIVSWLSSIGASSNVIESKSTYSARAGRYISQSVSSGYSDISGNFESGVAFFIEAKARGKRRTLRDKQFDFLKRKIQTNAFAYVCDDVEQLKIVYKEFCNKKSAEERRSLLEKHLQECVKTGSTPHGRDSLNFED